MGGTARGSGGSGLGVRVDVNEELKFLRKLEKKKNGVGVGGSWGRVGGQGGCDRRIEGFGKIHKKNRYFFFFFFGGGGGVGLEGSGWM